MFKYQTIALKGGHCRVIFCMHIPGTISITPCVFLLQMVLYFNLQYRATGFSSLTAAPKIRLTYAVWNYKLEHISTTVRISHESRNSCFAWACIHTAAYLPHPKLQEPRQIKGQPLANILIGLVYGVHYTKFQAEVYDARSVERMHETTWNKYQDWNTDCQSETDTDRQADKPNWNNPAVSGR